MGDPSLGVADLLDMTDDDVSALYGALFWNPIAGNSLPPAVALEVFDFAVNAGVRRSAMTLQQAVGATQDGSIGPLTLAAVAAVDCASLVASFAQLRGAYYQSLTSLFPIYGQGWFARTDACEAVAAALLPSSSAPSSTTGA